MTRVRLAAAEAGRSWFERHGLVPEPRNPGTFAGGTMLCCSHMPARLEELVAPTYQRHHNPIYMHSSCRHQPRLEETCVWSFALMVSRQNFDTLLRNMFALGCPKVVVLDRAFRSNRSPKTTRIIGFSYVFGTVVVSRLLLVGQFDATSEVGLDWTCYF